jgi:hypothetical protein
MFQRVPFTVGRVAGKYELWVDEEGMFRGAKLNIPAINMFGDQVLGGVLLGPVLVKKIS